MSKCKCGHDESLHESPRIDRLVNGIDHNRSCMGNDFHCNCKNYEESN